jgi:hypothetical protein
MRQRLSIRQVNPADGFSHHADSRRNLGFLVWNTGEDVMDKHGWIALGLGTFTAAAVGVMRPPIHSENGTLY